jgi:hypothetical protein
MKPLSTIGASDGRATPRHVEGVQGRAEPPHRSLANCPHRLRGARFLAKRSRSPSRQSRVVTRCPVMREFAPPGVDRLPPQLCSGSVLAGIALTWPGSGCQECQEPHAPAAMVSRLRKHPPIRRIRARPYLGRKETLHRRLGDRAGPHTALVAPRSEISRPPMRKTPTVVILTHRHPHPADAGARTGPRAFVHRGRPRTHRRRRLPRGLWLRVRATSMRATSSGAGSITGCRSAAACSGSTCWPSTPVLQTPYRAHPAPR